MPVHTFDFLVLFRKREEKKIKDISSKTRSIRKFRILKAAKNKYLTDISFFYKINCV